MDVHTYIKDPNKFVGKMTKISDDTFLGDPSELEDGKYLEYCPDIE